MEPDKEPFPLRHPDRRLLFQTLGDAEILDRYKKNFRLLDDVGFEHVRKHAALEAELTDRLIASTAENRAEVFEWAYSKLYSDLPWLVDTGSQSGAEHWLALMHPGASVYEIGSGAGYLVNYLAAKGLQCHGTDIASDRAKHATRSSSLNLKWGITDGVNLTRYAEVNSFDYVISNQVVEHLHPHNIVTHFNEARRLLKPGGKYIVSTPYAPFGPADLSVIFGLPEPAFMHLHEFSYADMAKIADLCSFSKLAAVFALPRTSVRVPSRVYLKYLLWLEKVYLSYPKNSFARRNLRKYKGIVFLRNTIWVIFTR